jgi:RNA polymerase sigma factor (sigma-70 family)
MGGVISTVIMVGVEPERTSAQQARFEALFREHYRAVAAYVRQVWPSVDEDEIMSNTFEVAWRRLDEVPTGPTRGWLIGVARNCSLNALRSQRRRQAHTDAFAAMRSRLDLSAVGGSGAYDTADALQAAFDGLREADREVLVLAAWEGLSGDDLGAALGLSGATATVRLFRARQRLRRAFDANGGSA